MVPNPPPKYVLISRKLCSLMLLSSGTSPYLMPLLVIDGTSPL